MQTFKEMQSHYLKSIASETEILRNVIAREVNLVEVEDYFELEIE